MPNDRTTRVQEYLGALARVVALREDHASRREIAAAEREATRLYVALEPIHGATVGGWH